MIIKCTFSHTFAIIFAGIMVNQAHIIEADIGASNGVIHAIDAVLIPPEFIPHN